MIERAIQKIRFDKFFNSSVQTEDFSKELPPFHSLQAALLMRLRIWKSMFFITLGIFSIVMVVQQRIIFHKLFQKMNEEVIVVPGSPEFFRVRPGQIPKESVFIFAEFVASNLGNFSSRNVNYRFSPLDLDNVVSKRNGFYV